MLIALAGRKSSGKTTVANILEKRGFKKASFATGLKELVSKLYDWDINLLFSQNGKEKLLDQSVFWNKDLARKMEDLIELKVPFDEEKTFNSRRDVLQYLGTDILRKIDPDFHVKEFKKRYIEGNFVCDDLRFKNELNIINEMKGIGVFIIRPYSWNYSNHISEISLNRNDFKYIFLNDGSERKLIRKFSMFFDNLLSRKKAPIDRSELQNLLLKYKTREKCAEILNCSSDKITWWIIKYMLYTSRNKYQVNNDIFLTPTFQAAYWAGILSGDGTIKKHLINDYLIELTSTDKELVEGFRDFVCPTKGIYERDSWHKNGKRKYSITVSSQFMVEDLKLWNLEPRKSKHNKIPDCIKNNDELMCYWLVGLIDSDGSIYFTQNGNNVGIDILASLEIIQFLFKWLNIPGSISQEKKIENLYNLRFSGKNSVALYNKIYKGVGLRRKWSKVEKFLQKEWRI